VRYVGGQWWLSRPSAFLSVTVCMLWRQMRISSTLERFSWTMLRFCNVRNGATDYNRFR